MTQVELAAAAAAAAADGSPDVQSLKTAATAGAEPSEAPAEKVSEEGFVTLTEDGGLKKRVLKEGSGEPVPKGANVEVHYVGTLYPSGKKFDASRDRDAPFNFRLGQGQVIKGWDVGVQSMRVGELAELLCKPEYAYGAAGSPPNIPANSTLKFEVEVLGFEEVAETPEQHWAAAKSKREEGNRAFRDGKIAAAKAAYTSATTHVSEAEDAESVSEDERKSLTAAIERNLAMCCLKLGENNAAAKWCDAVLEDDPLNVKAFYLRGQAYLAMSEFDRAVQAVEEGINATASNPDSADLKTLLTRIRIAKADAQEKEKSMYKRMFR